LAKLSENLGYGVEKILEELFKYFDKDIEAFEPWKYYDDKQTKKLEEFVLELFDKKHNQKYNWY
jgi:hypothetical protein